MPGGVWESAASVCSRVSLHETADEYARVLAASGRWRVIRCRDDLQFIVQKRRGRTRARPWQAVAYVLSARALGPVLHRPSLCIPADDFDRLSVMLALLGILPAKGGTHD